MKAGDLVRTFTGRTGIVVALTQTGEPEAARVHVRIQCSPPPVHRPVAIIVRYHPADVTPADTTY